jgi:3-hydroxyacyl-CoA dehydrogenase/enoyl-CoA hydratase/3-hydroxybutyryl-CoA epimerase
VVKKLKKTPIVIKDSPGFIVNRILMPYMSEALFLVEQGVKIQIIDKVMKNFGMPMGPFELADLVGWDIVFNVSGIFEDKFGEKAPIPQLIGILKNQENLLGQKTGNGFYSYKGKKKEINTLVENLISNFMKMHNIKPLKLNACEIEEIILYRMVNEAYKCLEEKIIDSPEHIDMAMIMGAGFPPFRGGIIRYAESAGLSAIKTKLDKLAEKYGKRFEASELLNK